MLAKPMTINERMMYSAVRIAGRLATGAEIGGTGFFLSHPSAGGPKIRMLVSNRHVVGGMTRGTLHLHQPRVTSDHGQVVSATSVPVEVDDFETRWVPHPNPEVDLCALPYDAIHAAIATTGRDVYATFFESAQVIPPDEGLASVDAAEEVQLIGYPEGAWDPFNNYPVFRRGTIATHPRVDYRGRPEILIDAGSHNGSSGSPAVLVNRTNYKEEETETWPVILLGVLSAGVGIGATGTAREEAVLRTEPRTLAPAVMHFCVIAKARELLVLADAVAAKVRPPV